MSKPYQHTFESIQSPLSGPGGYSNPASPVGGQPPSFKTNLNRAKTKKWVEAKGYSYDGDDWGEVDEYDEYGGYDEPQPPAVPAVPAMPPLPKQPTGLRQKGQSAASPRSSPQTEQTGVFSPPAKQGSSPSIGHQQHYNGPSAVASSGSSAVPRGVSPGRPRANSFEQGDDAVAMPSALAEPGGAWGQVSSNEDQSHIPIRTSATGSPVSHSPTLHPWASGEAHAPQAEQKPPPLRIETQSVAAGAPPQPPTVSPKYATYSPSPSAGSHRAVSDTDRRHPSGPASRRQSVDSNAPSVELQSRRDFSPSVAPQRNPSASNSPNPNEFRFPPRKSSLSQRTASWNRTPRPYEDVSQAFPQSPGSETLQSPISDQGGFSTTKATTFVRPADIYKRIEAERERERRSLDSGRPSLDSVRSRSSEPERVTSPPLRERLSSESLGRSIRGRSSFDGTGDLESNRRLKPMLDPVKERKSEYGFEGFSYEAAKAAEEQSKNPVDASSKAGQRDSRPILPDLNRISAFGDSLFGPTLASSDFLSGPEGQPPEAIAGPTVTEPVRDVANEKTLEHQPSLGFRSVVNQAFDRKDDKSVPPTPSSTDRSDIRSGSESTTEISPIMSRVPDIASLDAQAGNAAKTQPEMGAITEEINEFDAGSRPTSTATAIPADVVRTPSPPPSAHSRKTSENLPQGFVPGHRRDLSTPSPANSPARSPALKSTETNAAEKQAEVTSATPTDAQAVHHPSEQPSGPPTGLPEVASETEGQDLSINDTSNPLDQAEVEKVALEHRSPEASPTREPRSPTFSVSPRSGSESPSKGRVRDLAGMFDLNERSSRRGSATSFSSRGSVTEKAKDATDASRLVPNRLESFRPSLPGGWVSFSTMADNSPSRLSVVTDDTAAKEAGQKDAIRNENVPEFGPALQGPSEEGLDLVQTSAGQGALSPESRVPEHDAFAAAAAAGAAMGASIADSVRQLRERGGFDSTSPSDYERNEHTDTSLESSIHSHVAPHFEIHSDEDVVDQGLDAQTSSPMPQLLTPSNLESSGSPSVGPTPPPKDTPYQTGRAESDYFPPTLPLKHKSINPAMQPPILNPTVRPEILPSLSTETSPQDLESDRLRKEIVRRLSPMSSSEQDALRELEDSEGVPDNADSKSFDPARESTFLPSEYDSYWDHGERDDDEDEDDEVTSGSRTPPARAEQSLHPVELESDQFTLAKASHEPAAEPEQHRDVPLTEQAGAASTMAQGPPLLKKKFSWEEDSRSQSPESVELHPPDYPSHGEAFEIPKPVSSEETRDSLQSVSTTIPHEQQLGEGQSSKDLQYSKREFSVPSGYRSSLPPYEEAMDVADGVAPDTASSEAPEPLRSSTSTGLHDIEIPASRPTSTALEHTSVIPAEQAPVVDQEKTGPIVGAPDDVAQSTQTTSQQKMPSFRDILALTNPFDRIQSYNIARKQLAESDSGLSNWITSITAANPEYADLVSTNREASQPAGSSTKRSVSSIQGPTHASGSIRITSHHMQTKGKDLLHSAGALGGRANIAAKGLFSKGRNKLRGSNAEKETHASPLAGGENSASCVPSQTPLASQRGANSKLSEQGRSATTHEQEIPSRLDTGPKQNITERNVQPAPNVDEMGKSPSRPALSSRGYTIRAVQPEPVYAPNSPEKDPNRFSLGQSLGVVNPDNNENDVREADDVDFEERNNTQDGSVQHEANTGANHAETSHEAHISQQSPVSALPIVSDPNVAMSLQTLTGTTTQGAYAVAERTAARSPHKNSQIPFRPYQVEVLNHGQEVRPATHRRSSTKDSYESSGYARRSSQGLLNTDQNGPGIGSDSSQLPSLAADVQAQQNDDHGRPRRSLHPRQHSTESYMQGPVLNHEEMLRAESRRRSMDLLRQFGGGSPVYLERRDSSGSTWSSSSKVGAHKKRRSSLFGLLSKPPTPEVPHGSRESAITHLANSKAEPDPANPPLKTQEGSGNSARPKDIAEKRGRNKLQRSSTSQFVQALDEKKKKRFSGLGGIFGRSDNNPKQGHQPFPAGPNVLVKHSHTRRNRESQALTQQQAKQVAPVSPNDAVPHPSAAGYTNWSAEPSATALPEPYQANTYQDVGEQITESDRGTTPQNFLEGHGRTSPHPQPPFSGFDQSWHPSGSSGQYLQHWSHDSTPRINTTSNQTEDPWRIDVPLPSSPLKIEHPGEDYYQHPAQNYHYQEDPQYREYNFHRAPQADSVSPLNAPVPGAGPVGPLSIDDPLTKLSSGSPSPIQELPGAENPQHHHSAAYASGFRT